MSLNKYQMVYLWGSVCAIAFWVIASIYIQKDIFLSVVGGIILAAFTLFLDTKSTSPIFEYGGKK